MPKSVLITGAGGFVGAALTRGFAGLGWDVTAVDRRFDRESPEEGVRRVTADLLESEQLELPASDVVIHGAWITSEPEVLGIHPSEFPGLNLKPLMAILAHVRRIKPEAFVFLSSSGVFSPEDGAGKLTDGVTPTATSLYGALKRAAEELILSESSVRPIPKPTWPSVETGLHVVRLGYLFGPGETARPSRTRVSLVARWVDAARNGRPLQVSSDDPSRDWTFTEDLAPALAKVLDTAPAGRPIHLCSPYVLRDSEWATHFASRFPGVESVSVPATTPPKAPMVASDVPAFEGFPWIAPGDGLDVILDSVGVS